jgi:hypothetical protein
MEFLEDRTMMDTALGALAQTSLSQTTLNQAIFQLPISLSSKPGASHSIYLDFDGHFDANWASDGWKFSNVQTPAFDLDGSPSYFNSSERSMIREIWQDFHAICLRPKMMRIFSENGDGSK